MGQMEIKRTRQLYLTTGSLKRDELRPEIVYSWVRSRLFGISGAEELVPIFQKEVVPSDIRVAIKRVSEYNFSYELSPFYCGLKGKVFHYISNKPLCYTFSEEVLGTNGLALAMHVGKASYVVGYEHYHESLIKKTTIGVPYKDNGYIGLVVDEVLSEKECMELIRQTEELLSQPKSKDRSEEETSVTDNTAYDKNIECSQVDTESYSLELLLGSRQQAREYLRAIGVTNVIEIDGRTFPWKVTAAAKGLRETVHYELMEQGSTLLCTNIEHFPPGELEHILDKTACKPVNENQLKAHENNGLGVYISSDSTARKEQDLLTGLQHKIRVTSKRVGDQGSGVKANSITVSQNKTPDIVSKTETQDQTNLLTLKESEERLIRETIEACDGNMKRVAEVLGISRSTLYRKIDKIENRLG